MAGIEMNAPAPNTCYFLGIPKEIRLSIYRYLLLPTKLISLSPARPSDYFGLRDTDPENEWVDESDSDDMDGFWDDDDEIGHLRREYAHDMEESPFNAEEVASFKKHPAILRANRQIYSEASSILYTESFLVLEPGDIFALAKKPHTLKFGAPNAMCWRHNPLDGIGKADEKGFVTYDSLELEGLMEPHVFARFQKIYFDALFDAEHTHYVELWVDDETFNVRGEDATRFQKLLRSSPVIKDFVKILSNSPRIILLEVILEVEIIPDSELMLADLPEDSDEEIEEQLDKLEQRANEKATELFLDSKIGEPLLNLTNVKNFTFKFGWEEDPLPEGEGYKRLPKHVKLLKDMKAAIEGNFTERIGSV